MTKYFVNEAGKYLGGFDGAEPPVGAIEVPSAPGNAADIWSGDAWLAVQPVPQAVTMQQAELALLEADLLDDIEALIPNLPRANQIAWKRASIVERTHPLVAYVQQTNGLTSEQIDALFVQAATL